MASPGPRAGAARACAHRDSPMQDRTSLSTPVQGGRTGLFRIRGPRQAAAPNVRRSARTARWRASEPGKLRIQSAPAWYPVEAEPRIRANNSPPTRRDAFPSRNSPSNALGLFPARVRGVRKRGRSCKLGPDAQRAHLEFSQSSDRQESSPPKRLSRAATRRAASAIVFIFLHYPRRLLQHRRAPARRRRTKRWVSCKA